jgi:hypothetical protein
MLEAVLSKTERNPKQFFAGSALTFAEDGLPLVVRPDATTGVHKDERIRVDSPRPESTGGDR